MSRTLVVALSCLLVLVRPESSIQANDEWPLDLDAGWQEAVLSVSNLSQWQEQLADIAGWQSIHEGFVDRRQLFAWGLDEAVTANAVVLQNLGESQGLVRLVKFENAAQLQIRSSAQVWDTACMNAQCTRRSTSGTRSRRSRICLPATRSNP